MKFKILLKRFGFLMFACFTFFCLVSVVKAGSKTIKMSTTTSTENSGLLDVLLPEFTKDTGIVVKVFSKGTGAAIRDGIDGNVDVIFVHARTREEKFVADGYGIRRYAVMHNDFVVLGPLDDPAGIKGMQKASEALKQIAATGALFISRGDDSGTHTKEQALWKTAGLDLVVQKSTIFQKGRKKSVSFIYPKGSNKWYLSIGQGMGKTITFADEKKAYTLADRGTYIKYKYGREEGLDLEVLCEGDPLLDNPYGLIPVNPAKHPHVRYDLAEQFAKWLVSTKGQSLILNYRLLGKQLFYPDSLK
jgi:tungstate transport system substrate-binding protein